MIYKARDRYNRENERIFAHVLSMAENPYIGHYNVEHISLILCELH